MTLLEQDLLVWLGNLFWPFLRIGAAFLAAPIFGARTVPVRIRIILALLLTLVIQATIPAMPAMDPFTADGMVLIVRQLLIGLAMGFMLQIAFSTVIMAGQVIATTMGLGFASTVDPQNGVNVTMLGQFYLIVATLIFLGMDGHLLLINILTQTFVLFPVGGDIFTPDLFMKVVNFTAQMFVWAAIIALPAVTGVLLVNLSFGVMTKAAPQLNIFALGFPMAIIAGFALMLLSIPAIMPVLASVFTESLIALQGLFG